MLDSNHFALRINFAILIVGGRIIRRYWLMKIKRPESMNNPRVEEFVSDNNDRTSALAIALYTLRIPCTRRNDSDTGKLIGKVALVTGGSRGIGAATARALADEGADVAISFLTSADKAETVVRDLNAKGIRAAAFKSDQGDKREVEGLINSVVEHFGHLDI